jgi:hypothetical protein
VARGLVLGRSTTARVRQRGETAGARRRAFAFAAGPARVITGVDAMPNYTPVCLGQLVLLAFAVTRRATGQGRRARENLAACSFGWWLITGANLF